MKNESTLRPSTHVWHVHLIDGLLGYVLPVTPLRSVAKTAFLVQQGCLTESQFCISLNNLLVCMPFRTHKELNTSSFQCSSVKITPPQSGVLHLHHQPRSLFLPQKLWFSSVALTSKTASKMSDGLKNQETIDGFATLGCFGSSPEKWIYNDVYIYIYVIDKDTKYMYIYNIYMDAPKSICMEIEYTLSMAILN